MGSSWNIPLLNSIDPAEFSHNKLNFCNNFKNEGIHCRNKKSQQAKLTKYLQECRRIFCPISLYTPCYYYLTMLILTTHVVTIISTTHFIRLSSLCTWFESKYCNFEWFKQQSFDLELLFGTVPNIVSPKLCCQWINLSYSPFICSYGCDSSLANIQDGSSSWPY